MTWRVAASMAIQTHCRFAFLPTKLQSSSSSASSRCRITVGVPISRLDIEMLGGRLELRSTINCKSHWSPTPTARQIPRSEILSSNRRSINVRCSSVIV